jgi:hypothetical protein
MAASPARAGCAMARTYSLPLIALLAFYFSLY